MSTHNLCFEQKYVAYKKILSQNFRFFCGKIFSIFEQACFRNDIFRLICSSAVPM